MDRPTEAELLAELAALRKQVLRLEAQGSASRQELAASSRRERELAALLRAHQAVTASLDLGHILEAIVHQA
ncbi:MAG: hypothetical protein HYY88_04685, partial [candidate division NC10 bacterium]|nr:hypothetical protein [candidate division NC10 bacterium]